MLVITDIPTLSDQFLLTILISLSYLKKRPWLHKHPYVHCSIIYHSQDMEETQVSINIRLDKEVVPTYGGILLSHKK